jgi:hypothetical protein
MAPLAAGASLSLLVQRKEPKKHAPAVRPPLRGGCAVPAGIFVRAILAHTKTAHVLCAALRVLPAATARPQGPKIHPRCIRRGLCSAPAFRVPMRHGEWDGYNPKGAAPDGRRFRMAHGCALRKFPDRSRTRSEAEGVPPGVCFFDSFFAQAKKCFSTAEWLVKNASAASGTLLGQSKSSERRTQYAHLACAFRVNRGCGAGTDKRRNPASLPLTPTPLPRGEGLQRAARVKNPQPAFCGRVWHTAWHITSTRPASSRTSPARNSWLRVRSTNFA